MKKLTILALVAISSLSLSAQRPSGEERQARRAEMVERQAERVAKDLELKGDAKSAFLATYKAYQTELLGVQQGRRNQRNQVQTERKHLSDEEAKKQVEEYFTQQEEQIAQQKKRLEVERKYYTEFQKTLTPQQLTKVFRQPQLQRQGGQQGGRPGGFGGPQGGARQGGFGGPGGDF